MFCLGTYGEFTEGGYFNEGCWVSNPYNAKNGGPCAGRPTSGPTRGQDASTRQRLRYLIARWGYSPNVFAWEFWNEVPEPPRRGLGCGDGGLPEEARPQPAPGQHHLRRRGDLEMPRRRFHHDPHVRPGRQHRRLHRQIAHEARRPVHFDKPYLLAEFGIDWQTGDERWDRLAPA